MPTHSFAQRLLPLVFAAWALSGLTPALAQTANDIQHARIQIDAGDVMEILGLSTFDDAKFDWVLTNNGSFVEAGRDRIYRTRLTQPGSYSLDGEMTSTQGNRRLQIDVTVLERSDGEASSPSGDVGLAIVTTDITAGQSGVQVPPDSPVLTITPSPALTGPINADLDASIDSDGDGDPQNDNDVSDTLFTTEHNPLRLWYAVPESATPMHLSTIADDGTEVTQDLAVAGGDVVIPTASITQGDEQAGTVAFTFPIDSSIPPESIVYQWDFGDGRQSLIDEPKHTYVSNGQYTVHVTVREMATGRVLVEGEGRVSVNSIPAVVTNSSSSQSSAVSSVPPKLPPSSSSGGSTLGTIMTLLFLLVLALALGAAAVWAYAKISQRTGSLQGALEKVEGKLIKKDGSGVVDVAPAAMKLKRPDAPKEESVDTSAQKAKIPEAYATPTPKPATPVVPIIQEAAAPSWLQKGLATAKPEDVVAVPGMSAIQSTPALQPESPAPIPAPSSAPEPAFSAPPPLPASIDATASMTTSVPLAEPPAPAVPVQPDQPETLNEDDLLPPWLKEDHTGDTPTPPDEPEAGPATMPSLASNTPVPSEGVIPEPAPVVPTPVEMPPAPAPIIEPIAPVVSEPPPAAPAAIPEPSITQITPQSEPQIPAPLIEPATPVVISEVPAAVPAPVVAPVVQPEPQTPVPELKTEPSPAAPPVITEPAPVVTPVTPAVQSPAPVTAATPEDLARAERERERRRRKRQRYRENVKKRGAAEGNAEPDASADAPVVAKTPEMKTPVVPSTPPAPMAIVEKPAVKIPVAPSAPPAPKPTPAPAPVAEKKPTPKDIPLSTEPASAKPTPAQKSDDTVAFIIKAEDIGPKTPKAPKSPVKKTPKTNGDETKKV